MDRHTVLRMLQNGEISVEEAEGMLSKLRHSNHMPNRSATNSSQVRKPKKLRIVVENMAGGKPQVNLTIPTALLRTASPIVMASIPKEVKMQMKKSGIDIPDLLKQIEQMLNNHDMGDVVNIQTESNGQKIHVHVYLD